MRELQVIFHSPREVARFVQLASTLPGEILVTQDNRMVNGKDLLGMFSLDLRQQICVDYSGDDAMSEDFLSGISCYLA
ncbi:MAG: HPr family phosphocarrier protein [Oscillospiraceae bacterium]|nr:HPr family phosphocarrier protein [Oscillospiraceae bacterium]